METTNGYGGAFTGEQIDEAINKILNNDFTGPVGPDGNPVGTVISFMGTKAPSGYLICDGTEYDAGKYPKLAALFQEQFGAANYFGGDGEATFAVPDMRNLFLRGFHGEAEERLSGEVGERQAATEAPVIERVQTSIANNLVFCASATNPIDGLTVTDADTMSNPGAFRRNVPFSDGPYTNATRPQR